jgi:hypothetical protein
VPPVRRDGADDDTVARLEDLDLAADLVHDADRLVAERQIRTRAYAAADGMRIGGADQRLARAYHGIVRAGYRNRLVHEPDAADFLHDKGFHRGTPIEPGRLAERERRCGGRYPSPSVPKLSRSPDWRAHQRVRDQRAVSRAARVTAADRRTPATGDLDVRGRKIV